MLHDRFFWKAYLEQEEIKIVFNKWRLFIIIVWLIKNFDETSFFKKGQIEWKSILFQIYH